MTQHDELHKIKDELSPLVRDLTHRIDKELHLAATPSGSVALRQMHSELKLELRASLEISSSGRTSGIRSAP